MNKDTGEVISGQGLIPEGFQHYMLKYDDNSTYPFAKLEYVYYRMALGTSWKQLIFNRFFISKKSGIFAGYINKLWYQT